MRHAPCIATALAGVLATAIAAGAARLTDPAALRGTLLVRHARLVDGTGAPPRDDTAILIGEGRIVAIGPDAEVAARARGAAELDATGMTVLPGLIDAHVHLQEVLGADVRGDSPEMVARLRRQQLRSYLACGVTTVLDTAIRPDVLAAIRGWLAAGEPGPSFLTLGPPIAARGGYMSSGFTDFVIDDPSDVGRSLAAAEAAGAFGVKVPLEQGFARSHVYPIHDSSVRKAIQAEAAARNLPIFVHGSDEEEYALALDMGAQVLAHANFGGLDPTPQFVERLAASGAYVVTTFSIVDAELIRFDLARLDDPLVAIAIPPEELATARDPDAWWAADVINLGYVFPRLPRIGRRVLAWFLADEKGLRDVLATNLRAARTLHDHGVPLVIGSDAGNFVLAQFHGTSTLREMELLASTGVPPAEVLAAATRVPARMLQLEHEVGSVEVGRRGDLVIVRDDPLRDVTAIRRSVAWTVKAGVARTPAEWMQNPEPP